MKRIQIQGYAPIDFYEDDTIERVRQLISITVGVHPDSLFCEIETELPATYYSNNPKHWTELFFRLSRDGTTIKADTLDIYRRIRPETTIAPRDVSLEDWEKAEGDLGRLRDPEGPFRELRILGVEAKNSIVLPLPPQDVPDLKSTQYPIPKNQSLFGTLHAMDDVDTYTVHVTPCPAKASPITTQIYYPLLRADTPERLSDSLANSILASQKRLTDLLALKAEPVESYSIIYAKWYIPLVSTRFTAPRSRFEEIFYGMTVSKTTPHIAYFTSRSEKTRHKFFVDKGKEKTKETYLDTAMLSTWFSATQPQRRLPSLLLYRSNKEGVLSRKSFDRILITPTDIVLSVSRKKDSKDTEQQIRTRLAEWLASLDALIPFIDPRDMDPSRWQLGELSVHGTYATSVGDLYTRRFPCVQTIFERQGDEFGLLRSEQASTGVSALELQAYRILSQANATPTPELLQEALSVSPGEAQVLFTKVQEMASEGGEFEDGRELPLISFKEKEVTIRFITGKLDRAFEYANMLRHVLTVEQAPEICEVMMAMPAQRTVLQQEQVAPVLAIANAEGVTEEDADQFGTYGGARKSKKAPAEEEGDVMNVREKKTGTYNYFNSRLQEFDPDTFDKTRYPGKCEKKVQVVVMTDKSRQKIKDTIEKGERYTYEDVHETEKLELEGPPEGTAICPPYWCMRDEIPLRQEQLKKGEDGSLQCPVCGGKVDEKDTKNTRDYTVIKRNVDAPYPNFMTTVTSSINGKAPPCCYRNPRGRSVVLPEAKSDTKTYVLNSLESIDPLRFAKIPEDLATKLGLTLNYSTTIVKGSLGTKKHDLFCVGLGRHPTQTLPTLFGTPTVTIPAPGDPAAEKNILRCSFFRTWQSSETGEESLEKRIIKSIDTAFREQRLTLLQELEYATSFLECEVIFLNPETYEVECGFWFKSVKESRTLVVIGSSVLCDVSRMKRVKQTHELTYDADVNSGKFPREMVKSLWVAHSAACSLDTPVLDDAIAEMKGKSYHFILDPFKRIQAVYIPGEVILPVEPTEATLYSGVPFKNGYADLDREELPTGAAMRAFLTETDQSKYKLKDEFLSVDGKIVELRITSNLRIPIRPEDPPAGSTAKMGEVIDTIMMKDDQGTKKHSEEELVTGVENAADRKQAERTAYEDEIYEFLMFSLAHDIEGDSPLRTSIAEGSDDLKDKLSEWYDENAHDDTRDAIKFVNKVRKPCGQYTTNTCESSSLCMLSGNTCKIGVKSIVSKAKLLHRMEQTLKKNDKQRALVLDNRMSPFFSTVLYLELPNEFITVDV